MMRIFAVKCHWSDTGRMRKEYIEALDKEDLLLQVKEKGGYRIRTINEDFNHLPNKHQLIQCKRYNIDHTGKTKIELRQLIKQYENEETNTNS